MGCVNRRDSERFKINLKKRLSDHRKFLVSNWGVKSQAVGLVRGKMSRCLRLVLTQLAEKQKGVDLTPQSHGEKGNHK